VRERSSGASEHLEKDSRHVIELRMTLGERLHGGDHPLRDLPGLVAAVRTALEASEGE